MRRSKIIAIAIILLSFALAFYFCPLMPEKMASHWNVQGEIDGYTSKWWGLFLMPIISLGMFLFFILIPKIDPLKENIKKFRKYFDGFMVLIIFFLFYIYLLSVFWNLGLRFDMSRFMMPTLGLLFYYCGILVKNAKRNWFIGIRTPWTLSNDKVWEKTHKMGGKLFKVAGLLVLVGIFFPKCALFFVLIPIFLIVIYLIVYSYLEYQKETKT